MATIKFRLKRKTLENEFDFNGGSWFEFELLIIRSGVEWSCGICAEYLFLDDLGYIQLCPSHLPLEKVHLTLLQVILSLISSCKWFYDYTGLPYERISNSFFYFLISHLVFQNVSGVLFC